MLSSVQKPAADSDNEAIKYLEDLITRIKSETEWRNLYGQK